MAGMGVVVGIAAIEGYSNVPLEEESPPIARVLFDFLVQHEWATALMFTVIIFVFWLIALHMYRPNVGRWGADLPEGVDPTDRA